MEASSRKVNKVILVVGASSGFGEACTQLLAKNGHTVIGTSRRAPPIPSQLTSNPTMIPLDVKSDESVAMAVKAVIELCGRVDVVINSAGIGYAGSVEDMSMDEYRDQLDTNFFGAVRVTKAVLPNMRQQRSGLFINISSIGGFMGLPFQSAYSASKFALEGFTESLRVEVKPFGIRALILQPGDFKTGITDNRIFCEANTSESVYHKACKDAIDTTISGELSGQPPIELAKKVAKLIQLKEPSVRYTCGPTMQCLAAKAKYWMPASVFEKLITSEFKQ